MDELAALDARDPARVAGGRRDTAIQRHRGLVGDERAAGAGPLAEGLVEQAGGGRLGAAGELHVNAAVAEHPRSAAGGLVGRILRRVDDARDPGLEDRLRAGRLAALVGAGLEGHVDRRAGGVLAVVAGILDSGPLGMESTQLRMEPLSDHLAVAHDHGAYQWVGADAPATALGELKSALQVGRILFGADRHLRPSRLIDWSVSQELYGSSLARHAEGGTSAG